LEFVITTFYNSSPEGLTGKIVIDDDNIIDLNDEDTLFLQKIAWRTFDNQSMEDILCVWNSLTQSPARMMYW
jgi:hypothetical protein